MVDAEQGSVGWMKWLPTLLGCQVGLMGNTTKKVSKVCVRVIGDKETST